MVERDTDGDGNADEHYVGINQISAMDGSAGFLTVTGSAYRWYAVGSSDAPDVHQRVTAGETAQAGYQYGALSGATQISASDSRLMIVMADGTVYGAGADDHGELGGKDFATDDSSREKGSLTQATFGLPAVRPVRITVDGADVDLSAVPEWVMKNTESFTLGDVSHGAPYVLDLTNTLSRETITDHTGYTVSVQGGDTELLTVTDTGAAYQVEAVAGATGTAYLVLRAGETEVGRMKVSVVADTAVTTASGAAVAPMVAAGDDFTLALASDGKVYSWGTEANGVLGRTANPGYAYGQVEFLDDTGSARDIK